METTAYFPKRKCESCGAAMSPWKPRRRKGDQLVCDGCAITHTSTQHTAIPAERQPNYDRAHHRFTNPEPAPVGDLHFAYADMMSRMYPGQHAHIMKMLNDQTGAHWPTAASKVAHWTGDEVLCPRCAGRSQTCHVCMGTGHVHRDNPVAPKGDRLFPVETARHIAHDSGDGETIFHCPFCGSGAVTAGGDGTVSCDYCKTNFTVQVQPEFSAFPQSVDGQPYDVPGMPGTPGPDPMADPNADPTADPNADPNANPFDSGGGDQQAAAEEAAAATQAAEDDLPEFLKKSHFITAQGAALDSDAYLKHLAIRFADDPVDVLAAVRSENNRKG